MVTHHLNHIMAADVIWYLEAGRLLEVGSPAELLSGRTDSTIFWAWQPVAI